MLLLVIKFLLDFFCFFAQDWTPNNATMVEDGAFIRPQQLKHGGLILWTLSKFRRPCVARVLMAGSFMTFVNQILSLFRCYHYPWIVFFRGAGSISFLCEVLR